MSAAVKLLSLGCFLLPFSDGKLDYESWGDGMQLQGDFSLAGFFPLHQTAAASAGLPAVGPCNAGTPTQHGFHLMQAMRFTVEEINNSTALLPGVKLGYQMYDICSEPASILATLDLLSQQQQSFSEDRNSNQGQRSVAIIGPDSSSKSFPPAALLGAYLVPQISYEATTEQLSNKFLYPSFFRTIPSDKNQVTAMIQLLLRFNWTWIAIIASDNAYGIDAMQSLSQQAPLHSICIAFQGLLSSDQDPSVSKQMVKNILKTKVTTIIIFASRTQVPNFFAAVIEQNVTDKVWLASEDWSLSSVVSGVPGVHTIGTVLGISIKNKSLPGFEEFERRSFETSMQHSNTQEVWNGTKDRENECLHSTDLYSLVRLKLPLYDYDVTSSFNVYKAVYAVAHALHQVLGCDSERCEKRSVQPWQLLPWIKQVRFPLGNMLVYFDESGNPPAEYDIVTWFWRGTQWSFRVVGLYRGPMMLTVDAEQVDWRGSGDVPLSICSPACLPGHEQIPSGPHTCCFDCQACPTNTFLNKSHPTACQPCPKELWSPPRSEHCLKRTVLLLAWDAPFSKALLFFMAVCLLMTSGSAVILLLNLNTPVSKSAGGHTCLLMLAALTAAAASSLCHFGPPSPLACVLKQPLFIFSFTVCLACITVRSFQVVCIFKFASKLPPAYDKWAKKRGPEFTILLLSASILLISVLRVTLDPPQPSQDLDFYLDSVVLECSKTISAGSGLELVYVAVLSMVCFTFSYMGKDLPANYNEAKCITFSLMVYMISWISFFTIYLVSRDPFTMAAQVFATLLSVLAFLGGYFLPKIYIIVLKPQMNTTAHFQNCIQMYTMNKQ
ncbi:taste receptor type 1 member 1 [Thalassophryne amazonica]|uniref:taste receptor type 1 member 1 n=1 Tax=Thalassophryne amazonica TaxID=390379 RepID=UPI001470E715|nr:taste receptor type 1 member 1 [Thalassophryne amazonica]